MRCWTRRTALRNTAATVGAVVGAGVATSADDRSRVSRQCTPRDACVPEWTSVVLLYARDALGAAIRETQVTISPPVPQGPHIPAREQYQTDWHGLAVLSLEPDVRYRVHVRCPGFHSLELADFSGQAGGLKVVHLRLEVDKAQLE